jgi:hypothetical protein
VRALIAPEIYRIVVDGMPLPPWGIHGPAHWSRVAWNAQQIVKKTPGADAAVARLFPLLHDARRLSNGRDPEHGARGAQLARDLGAVALGITPAQLDAWLDDFRRREAARAWSRKTDIHPTPGRTQMTTRADTSIRRRNAPIGMSRPARRGHGRQ